MQLLTGVGSSDTAIMPRVLAHYKTVAPLMEASFAGAPIVYRNYPGGLDKDGIFYVTSLELDAKKLLWLVHAKFAIEFLGWAPLRTDEHRLRFARILLEAPVGVDFTRVKKAAFVVRDLLRKECRLQAVPLVDGGSGIALWIGLPTRPTTYRCAPGCTRSRTAPPNSIPISSPPKSTPTMTAASTCTSRATPKATTARCPIRCARKT